jgi:hypothetical protein
LKYTVTIPDNLNTFQREELSQRIIQTIKERTNQGIGVNGQKFASYSSSYVNSLPFRIAGKSASQVNLRLSDEMMDSLEVVDSGSGFITLGFTNASAEQKAEWNAASDNGPSREFLGISQSELDALLSDYTEESEETTVSESLVNRVLEAARQRILNENS